MGDTIGLYGGGGGPESDAILWPTNKVLGIEVGVEGFGHDVEVDVVIVEHIEK